MSGVYHPVNFYDPYNIFRQNEANHVYQSALLAQQFDHDRHFAALAAENAERAAMWEMEP